MLDNFKGYIKKGWKNAPDKSTPLSADNLDYMDSGIKNNADAIKEIAGAVSKKLENDSEKIPTMNLLFEVNKNAKEDSKNAADIANEAKGVAESAIGNFSDKYEKKPYKKGETCIQNNVLYEANADINPAEDWNAAHWTETSVEKIRAKMRQEFDVVNANIANITPDDTAVGSKPWTSKHIVDMLCPPLEVSGNPVQCYPVPGYPLGITASWEPVQEGSGDPSPENIRPIKGRDSVTVTRCGQNLLNIKKLRQSRTSNGITYTMQDDGSIQVSGTSTGKSYLGSAVAFKDRDELLQYLPSGKYWFGLASGTTDIEVYLTGYTLNGNALRFNASDIIEASEPIYITFQMAVKANVTVKNVTIYPIIVQGAEPTDTYIPYTGDISTLTLPETIYGGSVDAVTGEGKKISNKIELDGTENWIKTTYTADTEDTFGFAARYVSKGNLGNGKVCICSHFPYNWGITSGYTNVGVLLHNNGMVYVRVKVAGVNSIDTWKAYLAAQYASGTPVQIAYTLRISTTFQSLGASSLLALSDINTILTDADSVMVTARKDPVHLFDILSG